MENQNDQVLVTRKTFLTGGQRAGYLFAGLLGGAGCAILASLCNMDAPYRSDCTKFAVIGLGIRIALSVVGYIAVLPLLAMPYYFDFFDGVDIRVIEDDGIFVDVDFGRSSIVVENGRWYVSNFD